MRLFYGEQTGVSPIINTIVALSVVICKPVFAVWSIIQGGESTNISSKYFT